MLVLILLLFLNFIQCIEIDEYGSSVFLVGNDSLSRSSRHHITQKIKVKESNGNHLPPFYLIELWKKGKFQFYSRCINNCVIYESTNSESIMYRERYTGFWYIEDILDGYPTICTIKVKKGDPSKKLAYRHNETLPAKNGWVNTDGEFGLHQFDSCGKRDGIRISSERPQTKENINECLELAKIISKSEFALVSIKIKTSNNNVECTIIVVSQFQDSIRISVEQDPDSAFYVMDQNCTFEDKINFPENENTNHLIGGISGGVALFLIILIIGIFIFVIRKRNIKEAPCEKAIVHQNDLYGNISNQEEHEERYDTNIVDTNQYYEDYDNIELK